VASNLEPPLRGEPLFDELGNQTIRFAEFLSGLSVEVNAIVNSSTESFIPEPLSSSLAEDVADLQQIEDLIPAYENRDFYSTIKSADYTAVSGDFVEARDNCIITLDPNADADDQIIVANGDGTRITVLGDIKFTRLDTKMFIRRQGTSMHFQMFVDGMTKYWRIR
jgi:hypothetical protein